MDTLTWLRLLGAGAIGAVAWHGAFWAIPLSIFMPCLVAGQPTRLTAAGAAFAYYAGASWPVIAVARSYWPSIGAGAPLLWLAAAVILSLPWILFWTLRASLRPWTIAIALGLSAVPPLCIVGWASPLVSAGVLFPNTGWLGLVAILALPGFLLNKATRGMALFTAAVASLVLNFQAKPLAAPHGWEAETTRIHRSRTSDALAEFNIERYFQRVAVSSRGTVLVFPEGAVRRWTDVTGEFWSSALASSGKTVLIGSAQPIAGSSQNNNSLVVVGKQPWHAVHQRIPVPGGMWNPLARKGGFALNLLSPGTVDIGGERAAILICYEQLLTWPMLRSAVERPTVLITLSNEAWTASTVIPNVQHACARAWARLFGLPVLSAINS